MPHIHYNDADLKVLHSADTMATAAEELRKSVIKFRILSTDEKKAELRRHINHCMRSAIVAAVESMTSL